MAISSITKNFIISGQEQVEQFVDALEASVNDRTPRVQINVRELTDKIEIEELLRRRQRNRENAVI